MEALAILFWSVVLIADLAFMANIRRLADELFPLHPTDKKRPGGAATPSQGMSKMTDLVYHITKEVSKNDH